MASPLATSGFYPGRAPIDAYGGGGFRFAGMSHRGSLLVLPDGIRAWPVAALEDVQPGNLADLVQAGAGPGLVLLGLGTVPRRLPVGLAGLLDAAGLAWDAMDTGAACRTYNILLAEGRPVCAALIAVP